MWPFQLDGVECLDSYTISQFWAINVFWGMNSQESQTHLNKYKKKFATHQSSKCSDFKNLKGVTTRIRTSQWLSGRISSPHQPLFNGTTGGIAGGSYRSIVETSKQCRRAGVMTRLSIYL